MKVRLLVKDCPAIPQRVEPALVTLQRKKTKVKEDPLCVALNSLPVRKQLEGYEVPR